MPSWCFIDVPAPFNVNVPVPLVSQSFEEFAESPCEQVSAKSSQHVDVPVAQIFPKKKLSGEIFPS